MKRAYKRRSLECLLNRSKSKKARVRMSLLSAFIIIALSIPLITLAHGVTLNMLLATANQSDELASIAEMDVSSEPAETEDSTDTGSVNPQDANPEDPDAERADTEGSDTQDANPENTNTENLNTQGTDTQVADTEGLDTEGTNTDDVDSTDTETGRPETGNTVTTEPETENIETVEPEIGNIETMGQGTESTETIQLGIEGTDLDIEGFVMPMQVSGTPGYVVYWNLGSGFFRQGSYPTLAGAVAATSGPGGSQTYYIHVLGDDPGMAAAVTIPANRVYTISSVDPNPNIPPPGAVRTIRMNSGARHLIINGAVTLDNIILDGSLTGGGVHVRSDGRFTMNTNSVIQRCVSSTVVEGRRLGGGVFVESGTMTMNENSLITENFANRNIQAHHGYGGGVYLQGGSLTMNGGSSISGNIANDFSNGNARDGAGGGVFLGLSSGGGISVLNMTGNSSISGNTASTSHTLAPESFITAGGVYISQACEFNMSGNARLTGNVAGANRRGNGGGVYIAGNRTNNERNRGKFIMNNGTISNNYASTADAGGAGSASYGGGVHVCQGGRFILHDGTISGNFGAIGEGVEGLGGGVSIVDNFSEFEMRGGTISGNTASKSGPGNGGGIYLSTGEAEIQGGTISGNSAPQGHGGGIYTSEVYHTRLIVRAAVNFGSHSGTPAPNTASIQVNLDDYGVTKTDYESLFSTIRSSYGRFYSTTNNHPVNNYDISTALFIITEKHVDTLGRELEPKVDDNVVRIPQIRPNYLREIPGVPYHITKGFNWDTAPGGTDFVHVHTVNETINGDRVVYFVYALMPPPMGVSLSLSGTPIIPLLLAAALIPVGFKIAGLIRRRVDI